MMAGVWLMQPEGTATACSFSAVYIVHEVDLSDVTYAKNALKRLASKISEFIFSQSG